MEKRYAVGNFICQLRKEKGLTQKELGELLGVTNKAVSKWETGAAMPRLEYLQQLAVILCCTQEELFLGGRLPNDATLKHPVDVMTEYRSVVERCDTCRHVVKRIRLRKPMKCVHCGATVQMQKKWEVSYLLALMILGFFVLGMCRVCAFDLTALTLNNVALPLDKVALYQQLHEAYPLLNLYGLCTALIIYEIGGAVFFLLLKLLNLVLRRQRIFRITHYPHAEDGKIIF